MPIFPVNQDSVLQQVLNKILLQPQKRIASGIDRYFDRSVIPQAQGLRQPVQSVTQFVGDLLNPAFQFGSIGSFNRLQETARKWDVAVRSGQPKSRIDKLKGDYSKASKVHEEAYLFSKPISSSKFEFPLHKTISKEFSYKGKRGKVVNMTPDRYINTSEKLMRKHDPRLGKDFDLWKYLQSNKGLTDKYVEAMKKGDKFPMGSFERLPSGELLQEGNHRAMAAKILGIEEIPVFVITKAK